MDKKAIEGNSLSPRRLVEYLDRYIIAQGEAKKAVAVALRNRWRRLQVTGDIKDEITPKNILMIGPTGVGKTEIARRLAKLLGMPFVKVEASKYTEVGYVGRDVESMVRDLMEQAVALVKREREAGVSEAAEKRAEERLLDLLETRPSFEEVGTEEGFERRRRSREKTRTLLRNGALANQEVSLEVTQPAQVPGLEIFGGPGMEEMGQRLKEMMGGLVPGTSKLKKLTVPQALAQLRSEEAGRLVDQESVVEEARARVEQSGVIFIDELDKVAGGSQGGRGGGPDVSREGVQRDLLPLVEGTTVSTKHGPVKTDHVLFIAAGAFHVAAPGDLIPELQGRFPIRVELKSLGEEELFRILTEPENSLLRQYTALLAVEGVTLSFTPEALRALARYAERANTSLENIGARRLHTVMEHLLEEISFHASEMPGQQVEITEAEVDRRLSAIFEDRDLGRFVL
jgi:ATP-dependent HslUV protease ATP-binding subunit HslU